MISGGGRGGAIAINRNCIIARQKIPVRLTRQRHIAFGEQIVSRRQRIFQSRFSKRLRRARRLRKQRYRSSRSAATSSRHFVGLEPLENRVLLSGSIAGTVWEDINGNGARDAGEVGMADVVVYLDANDNGQRDWADANGNNAWDAGEGEQWTRSVVDDIATPDINEAGNYLLSNVPAGSHLVRQIVLPGYDPTAPVSGELLYQSHLRDGVDGVDGLNHPRSMAISPDGRSLYATGSVDDALAVFSRDRTTGELTYITSLKDGIDGIDELDAASDVAVSPDGRSVYVTAMGDDALSVFDRDETTGALTLVESFKDGINGVEGLYFASSVVVSPDGRSVYVASNEGDTLSVFSRNETTGTLNYVTVLRDGVDGVDGLNFPNSVAVSSDGRSVYVVSGFDDTLVTFSRDQTTGTLTFESSLQDDVYGLDGLDGANTVAVSPDGRSVYVTAAYDDSLSVYSRDVNAGALTYVTSFIDGVGGVDGLRSAASVTVSHDGQFVYAVGLNDRSLSVFRRDVTTGALTYLTAFKDGVGGVDGLTSANSVLVSPDGRSVYVSSVFQDMAIATFAHQTDAYAVSVASGDSITGLDFGNDPQPVIVSGSIAGTVWEDWNGNGVRDTGEVGMADVVVYLDANDNGQRDWADANGNNIWDTGEGEQWTRSVVDDIATPDVNEAGNYLFSNVPDGSHLVRQIVPLGYDQTAPAPGALLYQSHLRDGVDGVDGLEHPRSMAISPDGRSLYVTGSVDDALAVFNRDRITGELTYITSLEDGIDGVDELDVASNVAVSPDGRSVYVTAIGDDALSVFDRDETTGALALVESFKDGVNGVEGLFYASSVVVSPDGRSVYVASIEGDTLSVFSRDETTGSLNYVTVLRDGVDGVDGLNAPTSVAVSPDGRSVYVASGNGGGVSIYSRDETTGVLTFLESYKDVLTSASEVTLSSDGRSVYVVSSNASTLLVFSRSQQTGLLTYVTHFQRGVDGVEGLWGAISVAVSHDGQLVYIAGLNDRSLSVFRRDVTTGALTYLTAFKDGVDGVDGLAYANSVLVSPDGRSVYVSSVFQDVAIATFAHQTDAYAVSVTSGESVTGPNFGNDPQPDTISGTIWADTNGDGIREAGEVGLADVVVYLDQNQNRQLDDDEQQSVTDAYGRYLFQNLAAGEYTVRQITPAGYHFTRELTEADAPQIQHRLAIDEPSSWFGQSLAVYGDRAIIGDSSSDAVGDRKGAAYVFDLGIGGLQKTMVPGIQISHHLSRSFGSSVAINDKYILIGDQAYVDFDATVDAYWAGAVHVLNAHTGAFIRTLLPDDSEGQTDFGAAIALHDDIAVIGRGSGQDAYIFDISTGEHIAKLETPQKSREYDFGNVLAINEKYIVMGAKRDSVGGYPSGVVYIYDLTTGELLTQLQPPNPNVDTRFGSAVAVSGDYVLTIGTQGSVSMPVVYVYDARSGKEVRRLVAENPTGRTDFVRSVVVQDDLVIVGAPESSLTFELGGMVYLFNLRTGEQLATIQADDSAPYDRFGRLLAMHNDKLLIRSNLSPDNENRGGSFYYYDIPDLNSFSVSLTEDESVENVNFANVAEPTEIHGTVWVDQNSNGTIDENEAGLAGVMVYLDTNGNGTYEEGEAFQITDDDGRYGFEDLLTGKYDVGVVVPQFYSLSSAIGQPEGAGTHSFVLSLGQIEGAVDFGLHPDPADVLGYVWADANGDGVRDADEIALPGITVYVDANGNSIREEAEVSVVTASDGSFSFLGLYPQAIAIRVELPANIDQTGSADLPALVASGLVIPGSVPDFNRGFGNAVAIGGGVILKGPGPVWSKSVAVVFDQDTGELLEHRQPPPLNGAWLPADNRNIAIHGSTAIVGDPGYATFAGAVYVFDVTTGDFVTTIRREEYAAYDRLGSSVDINQEYILVGGIGAYDAAGMAILIDASTGTQLREFEPNDAADHDMFGGSVALDGTAAIVGSSEDDDNGYGAGAVYLFDTVTGEVIRKVYSPMPSRAQFFGSSIAASNGQFVVGAERSRGNPGDPGVAYVFESLTGQLLFELIADGADSWDGFGSAIDFDNGIIAVGAPISDSDQLDTGAVYLFDAATGEQVVKLISSNPVPYEEFGTDVAIDGDVIAVTNRHGLLYQFDLSKITAAEQLDLSPHSTTTDVGFGLLTTIIGNTVWHDANLNGIQDDGESGIEGVTVELYQDTGSQLIDTAVTDANGNYLFTGLPAGQYSVQVVAPSGYIFTATDVGSDEFDNDFYRYSASESNRVVVNLEANEHITSIDAGFVRLVPVASVGSPYTIDEGQSVTFDGSSSQDPQNDGLTYTWDILGYGRQVDATGVSPTLSWETLTNLGLPSDGTELTVQLTVEDSDGDVSTQTTKLTVNNLNPEVALDNDSVIVIFGDPVANSGTFADPGGDVVSLTASFGTLAQLPDGTWTWQAYPFARGDSYQVDITATDSDGGQTTKTFEIIINLAPRAHSLYNYWLDEGSDLFLDASGSDDPGGTIVSFAWDLDADGEFDDAIGGITQLVDWQVLHDLGLPTDGSLRVITLRVTDNLGATDEFYSVLIIDNLAPMPNVADMTYVHNVGERRIDLNGADVDPITGEVIQLRDAQFDDWELKQRLGLSRYFTAYDSLLGLNAKWILADDNQFYLLFDNGDLRRWRGSLTASPIVGRLEQRYFADPDTLINLTEPDAPPADLVFFDNNTGELVIDPTGFFGEAIVTVRLDDGIITGSDTFRLTVTNAAPTVGVNDQAFSHTVGEQRIDLPATDADGDDLTYTVTYHDARQLAWDAVQAFGLNRYLPHNTNVLRANEKWLFGTGHQIYLLFENGDLRRWAGSVALSPVVANVGADYYADPNELINVTQPNAAPIGLVTVDSQNKQLVINPAGFEGDLLVNVTVTDGTLQSEDTFKLSITNTVPDVDVADQNLSHTAGEQRIALPRTDADGDELTYTVTYQNPSLLAYQADQQFNFSRYFAAYDTLLGLNAKWILGNGGFYLLFNNGELRRWAGGISADANPLVANVAVAYYDNPEALIDVALPDALPDGLITIDDATDELVINPTGFMGDALVTVTVSDGIAQSTDTFNLSVSNNAPTVDIADQDLSHTVGTHRIALPATDVDGDTLTYTVTVADPRQFAWEADQQFNFSNYFAAYDTLLGLNAKWILGNGGFYLLFANGDLRRWSGSFAASPIVANVGEAYYADPASLIDVQAPSALPNNLVTYDQNTNELVINAVGFTGSALVTVTADDGVQQSSSSFKLTVSNLAPTVDIDDIQIASNAAPHVIDLPAVDGDGDAVAYTVNVQSSAQVAFDTKTQFNLTTHLAPYSNVLGQNERWLLSGAGQIYLLLPNGAIRRWAGTFASSPEVARVDALYWQDPNALINAAQPPALPAGVVSFDAATRKLTINPQGFVGLLRVELLADDGAQIATSVFNVSIV